MYIKGSPTTWDSPNFCWAIVKSQENSIDCSTWLTSIYLMFLGKITRAISITQQIFYNKYIRNAGCFQIMNTTWPETNHLKKKVLYRHLALCMMSRVKQTLSRWRQTLLLFCICLKSNSLQLPVFFLLLLGLIWVVNRYSWFKNLSMWQIDVINLAFSEIFI